MTVSREDTLRREKGKALIRALYLSELAAASSARELALHEAESQLDRIARTLPDALRGGVSMTEIARVTGISRPTLYELRARCGGSVGDLRLAVLQAVITRNAATPEKLAERLGKASADIRPVVDSFVNDELLDVDYEQVGEDECEELLFVTEKGLAFLEHWEFEADRTDEDGGSQA
jgi:DNA-binding MarR family transcriptional regulator